MKVISSRWVLVLSVLSVLTGGGCQDKPPLNGPAPVDVEAAVRANLAQLGPEDQRLAEQQKYCPLMEKVRLGETGRPHKITVKGVSTFVCCESCVRMARNDPDQALAKVRALEQESKRQPNPLP